MCEIAVLDPDQAPIQATHQIAARFHEEQGDGIGAIAVLNEGDGFDYRVYKSTEPHWQTFYSFLKRNYDRAWRIIVHGRNATSGKVNRDTAHPIEVDCQHCEFDYVVHNGSVRSYDNKRAGLTSQGHRFNTEVDTEVIPHVISELPETVEDHKRSTYALRGNLNYLLFSDRGILVRVSQKYHLTNDFTMTCSMNDFDEPNDLGFAYGTSNEWMLITPDGAEPEIETKDRVIYRSSRTSSRSSTSTTTQDAADSGHPWNAAEAASSAESAQEAIISGGPQNNDSYVVEYKDLTDYDHLSVIMVAPGVLRLIDRKNGETQYIWRDEEPRLYYWYSPQPVPDNIDELEELAELIDAVPEGEEVEQCSLDDFPEERVTAAVKQEVTQTVADIVDLDDEDKTLRELQDEVMEAAETGTKAALSYT